MPKVCHGGKVSQPQFVSASEGSLAFLHQALLTAASQLSHSLMFWVPGVGLGWTVWGERTGNIAFPMSSGSPQTSSGGESHDWTDCVPTYSQMLNYALETLRCESSEERRKTKGSNQGRCQE